MAEEKMMDDLISRQAAIDAVKGRFSMPVDNLIVEVIGELPSAQPEEHDSQKEVAKYVTAFSDGYDRGNADAQPEIIRCKDCNHYTHMWYCEAWNKEWEYNAKT